MRVNSAAISGLSARVKLLAGNFDANNVSMMADPELAEAERVQRIFALFDNAERFTRDLASVLDAR